MKQMWSPAVVSPLSHHGLFILNLSHGPVGPPFDFASQTRNLKLFCCWIRFYPQLHAVLMCLGEMTQANFDQNNNYRTFSNCVAVL